MRHRQCRELRDLTAEAPVRVTGERIHGRERARSPARDHRKAGFSANDPILILTGSPGSGKTTVGRLLAGQLPRAVQLESDQFFHFIRKGYVEPWKPTAHAQNTVVMRIVADAASTYANAGYFTIIDGIIIPGWFFESLRDSLTERGHRVAYAVLRASLRTCQARTSDRAREPLSDGSAVEQLWNAFADLGGLERHVIDTDDISPSAVADQIARRISDLVTPH